MTILVVDDHSTFRACVRQVLEAHGHRVVGEAEDRASALAAARELRPDLALVDVYLPDADGIEVAAQLVALDRALAVILISSHDRAEVEPYVPDAGARGFVPKDELSAEAIEALLR